MKIIWSVPGHFPSSPELFSGQFLESFRVLPGLLRACSGLLGLAAAYLELALDYSVFALDYTEHGSDYVELAADSLELGAMFAPHFASVGGDLQ